VALAATTTAATRVSFAEPSAEPSPSSSVPVEVALHDAPPAHRTLTVEWNPLALFLARFSLNAVIAPGDHHAIVLSPFYTWASTEPYATNIDANGNLLKNAQGANYTLNVLPQAFHGFGGELGYRYYFERGGPRGFFVGPSFIFAAMTAKAGTGSDTSYFDLGGAVDMGYEAIVADSIVFSVGVGLQYAAPSKSIPAQQWPATIYANSGVQPRLLASFGYAF
jgi:hypothetical protein